MNIVAFPLRYLTLKDVDGHKLYKRDALFVLLFSAVLAVPFIFLDGNFFRTGGFLDRIGSFASVLTGFYIAALVGVASLASTFGGLDQVIEVGVIRGKDTASGETIDLTRRQYVCSLFGYLAFASLFVSISSIVSVVLSGMTIKNAIDFSFIPYVGAYVPDALIYLRYGLIVFYVVVVAHIVATTCHGLYYYIDRIYAPATELGSKAPSEESLPRNS